MESELSGIFRVKLVTKNIARGSPGIQFMHMRLKKENYPISAFVQSFFSTKKSPKVVNLPLTGKTLCLSF